MSNNDGKVAFEKDWVEEDYSGPVKGSKLDASKSKFGASARQDRPYSASVGEFNQQVKEVHSAKEDNKIRALEVGREFMALFNSKTLPENRGPKENERIRKAINDLILFAIDANNDHSEKEGIGSVGLITLLFNCIVKMNDRINVLDFKLKTVQDIVDDSKRRLNNVDGSLGSIEQIIEKLEQLSK